MRKKIIDKGYTVEVVSWENDGDNYRTEKETYSDKEEALAVKHLCENLFLSSNNGEGGIGNLMDDEYTQAHSIIVEYFINNPTLLKLNEIPCPEELYGKVKAAFPEENIDECYEEFLHEYIMGRNEGILGHWVDGTSHYNYDLLGYSQYYYSRICDSCTITYSEEDIYLEVVES